MLFLDANDQIDLENIFNLFLEGWTSHRNSYPRQFPFQHLPRLSFPLFSLYLTHLPRFTPSFTPLYFFRFCPISVSFYRCRDVDTLSIRLTVLLSLSSHERYSQ